MYGDSLKTDVKVIAEFDKYGTITPLSIQWTDGRVYTIDKILDVRRACSQKAGTGQWRYEIRIGNANTYLFRNHSIWFVENK